jgi:hypothetical protein
MYKTLTLNGREIEAKCKHREAPSVKILWKFATGKFNKIVFDKIEYIPIPYLILKYLLPRVHYNIRYNDLYLLDSQNKQKKKLELNT